MPPRASKRARLSSTGPGRTPSKGGKCRKCNRRYPVSEDASREEKIAAYHNGECDSFPNCKVRGRKPVQALQCENLPVDQPVCSQWTLTEYLWAIATNGEPTNDQLSFRCNTHNTNPFFCDRCLANGSGSFNSRCGSCSMLRLATPLRMKLSVTLQNSVFWDARVQQLEAENARLRKLVSTRGPLHLPRLGKTSKAYITLPGVYASTTEWATSVLHNEPPEHMFAGNDCRRARMLARLTCYVAGLPREDELQITAEPVLEWAATKITRWWQRHSRARIMKSIAGRMCAGNSRVTLSCCLRLQFNANVASWTNDAIHRNICERISVVCDTLADIPQSCAFKTCTTATSKFVWPHGRNKPPQMLVTFAFGIGADFDVRAATARIQDKLAASEVRVELAYDDIYCFCVVTNVFKSAVQVSIGNSQADTLLVQLSAWKNPHGVDAAKALEHVCMGLARNNDDDSASVAFCAPGTFDEPHPDIVRVYNHVWLELQTQRQTLHCQKTPCSGVFECTVTSVGTLTASHSAGAMTRLKANVVFSLNGSLHLVTKTKDVRSGQAVCFTPPLPHVVQFHGRAVFWCTPILPKICTQCKEYKHAVLPDDAAFVCALCAPQAHIACRDTHYSCLRTRLLHLANDYDAENPLVLALPLNDIF